MNSHSCTLILNPDFAVIIFRRESGVTSPVDENTLPITTELKTELRTYYRTFSELYLLGFEKASDTERRLLDADGFKLWLKLRQQLSPQYEVKFYSHFFHDEFDDPQQFLTCNRVTK